MIVMCVVIALLAVIVTLLPFFVGGDRELQSSRLIHSQERLEAEKQAILERFVEDLRAYESKVINKLMWQQRRQYLVNRYIDAARRLDYLRFTQGQQGGDS